MKRRTFLKVVGATTVMAALPGVSPALIKRTTLILENVSVGSQVAVFEELPGELVELYNGVATRSTLTIETDRIGAKLLIRIRKFGLVPFETRQNGDHSTINVPRVIDEVIDTELLA